MNTQRLSTIFQICFWLLFMTLQMVMSSNFMSLKATLPLSAVNIVLAMIVFYVNRLWLFPLFFEKQRFGLYILINVTMLVLLSHVFFRLDVILASNFKIENPTIDFPPFFPYVRMFTMLLFINFISLVFSLVSKVRTQAMNEKQLSEEKLNTEVRLLKAQINPHFIFNSLNNIYSLAYSKSDHTPEAVLKLSHMLRYVFYDCSRDEVTLESELEYIKNYIAFQQMKSPHEQNITLKSDEIDKNFRIAPMLFIPFVENSFKYSKIEDLKEAWVDIELLTQNSELTFIISNTHPDNGKTPGSGMGMQNVQNRLELTYPGKHSLEVRDENNKFEVIMKIKSS